MSARARKIYPERFDAGRIYSEYADYLEELMAGTILG
jgi:hypothetical protein